MKNHNQITKLFFGLIVVLTLTHCSSDDESLGKTRIPLFTEADLLTIHGSSEKSWRITNFINTYHDPSYHLEIELSCLEDDVYTFYSTESLFSVDLGEARCFGANDDGIFTADIEIFDGELILMDSWLGETIYLRFSRGFANEDQTAGGVSIRYFALAELSENRMVFHRAGGEFVNEYIEALIFETF